MNSDKHNDDKTTAKRGTDEYRLSQRLHPDVLREAMKEWQGAQLPRRDRESSESWLARNHEHLFGKNSKAKPADSVGEMPDNVIAFPAPSLRNYLQEHRLVEVDEPVIFPQRLAAAPLPMGRPNLPEGSLSAKAPRGGEFEVLMTENGGMIEVEVLATGPALWEHGDMECLLVIGDVDNQDDTDKNEAFPFRFDRDGFACSIDQNQIRNIKFEGTDMRRQRLSEGRIAISFGSTGAVDT